MATSPVAERYLTQSELLSTIRRYYATHGAWPTIREIEERTGSSPSRIKKISEGVLSAGLADWQGSHLRLTGAVFHSPIVTYQLTRAQLDAGPPYPQRDEIDMEVQDMDGFTALPTTRRLLDEVDSIKAKGGRYVEELAAKYDVSPKTVSNAVFRGRKKLQKAGDLLGIPAPSPANPAVSLSPEAAKADPEPTPKEIVMPHQASDTAAAGVEITATTEEFVSPNLCDRCVKWDVCPLIHYYSDQVSPPSEELPPGLQTSVIVFGARPVVQCDKFVDLARVS